MSAVGALVLGGDYRGLGIVRSLGRQGIPVHVVHGDDTIAVHSRYCTRALRWDGATDERFLGYLLELADGGGYDGWVLFPTSDESAWLVSGYHDELSRRFRLTTPPEELYAAAADKRRVYTLAASLGIETPRTWFPDQLPSLADIDGEFPLVVKPTNRRHANALTVDKAWRADDLVGLVERYVCALEVCAPDEVMVQEWVPGDADSQYSVAAVCVRGEPRLSVAARRARQYPRDFGRASTYVETIEHPALVKEATRLLQEIGLDGLVEVEFKQDERTGALKLLDVNVRVWGWHSIGAAAGVDFVHAAYLQALGESLDARAGAVGVRWARLAVDLPYALGDLASRRMRVGALLRSLRPPLHGPIAARDDLRPALMEVPLLVRTLRRRRADAR